MQPDSTSKSHCLDVHPLHVSRAAAFDFAGPDREEQLHIAWHYANLQPMWATDNLSKGARYEEG